MKANAIMFFLHSFPFSLSALRYNSIGQKKKKRQPELGTSKTGKCVTSLETG